MYDIRSAVRDLFVAARILWITSIDKKFIKERVNHYQGEGPLWEGPRRASARRGNRGHPEEFLWMIFDL